MATVLPCDLCGTEPAVMLETRMETGEVIGVGASCVLPFYLGAATSLMREMDGAGMAAYAGMVNELHGLVFAATVTAIDLDRLDDEHHAAIDGDDVTEASE
jgi:hypothetical protein